jgi:hypothetical protein
LADLVNAYANYKKAGTGELESNFDRKFVFFKSDPETQKELLLFSGTFAGVGGMIGGGIGGGIGAVCASPGGPIGVAGGFGIGFAIGAPIGAAIGSCFACKRIYPRYQQWMETEEGAKFADSLANYLSEKALDHHIICPITQMPVLQGVRTPNGRIYEKKPLVQWINQHGTDPLTREKLTKDQLIREEDLSIENARSTRKFWIEIKEDAIQLEAGFKNGLEARINDIEEQIIQKSNDKLVKIQKEWKEKKINYAEYKIKKAEIDLKYQL